MTSYELCFLPSALKEWHRLDKTTREQFKRKLAARLENPRIESARLRTMPDCYKIKLNAVGYRLVYRVVDETISVVVIAVGKREHNLVYHTALLRIH